MGFFTRLEKTIATKLTQAFVNAKTVAEQAGNEVEAAEQALAAAKQKAAKLSANAHAAALAAVARAQAETAALVEEARQAEERARYHAGRVESRPTGPVEPTMDTPPVVVPDSNQSLSQQAAAVLAAQQSNTQ